MQRLELIQSLIEVNLSEVKFAHQRPCQTVFGISKALLLPESQVINGPEDKGIPTERILNLVFRAIAQAEGAPDTIDLAKPSQPLDIPARINQVTSEEELLSLKNSIGRMISRLKISLDGSQSYIIDPALIDSFVEALFKYAQEKVSTSTLVTAESILEYMKQLTIDDFRLLVKPINQVENYPESWQAANTITAILSGPATATVYDVQPFVDRFSQLSDPDDVVLLVEANAGELRRLTENQLHSLLERMLKKIEYEKEIIISVLNSFVQHIDEFSRRTSTLINDYLGVTVEILVFENTPKLKALALETISIAHTKGLLYSTLLERSLSTLYSKYPHKRENIDELARVFVEHEFISDENWQMCKSQKGFK